MLYETWLVISYSAPHSQSVVRSKQIVIVVTTKNTFPLITRKQSALSSTQQLPSAQSGFVITGKQDWQQFNKKVDSARNDHGFHSTSSVGLNNKHSTGRFLAGIWTVYQWWSSLSLNIWMLVVLLSVFPPFHKERHKILHARVQHRQQPDGQVKAHLGQWRGFHQSPQQRYLWSN